MLGNFSCATPAFTMLAAFREASQMERVECSVIGYSSSLRKCSLPFPGSSAAAFEAGSRQSGRIPCLWFFRGLRNSQSVHAVRSHWDIEKQANNF